MNLKDEQVDSILDTLMFCSDTLQALEEEHDPILARKAGRVIDILIRELLEEGEFPVPECKHSFRNNKGLWNCHYHDSSVGYCEREFCPLEE